MSAPQLQPPYDPKKKRILSPEEQAMQPHTMRFPKETRSKDEQTQRLDNFLRTLGPQKADKPSDTAFQKKNNTLGSDTLNGRKAKDDIGVSYSGIDSLQREVKQKLQIDQQNKGFDTISSIMDIDNRLNQTHKKLTDDYMNDRGVNPKEFRDTGKKLHKYLEDALEDKAIPTLDYEIALKKFNSMVKKLDIIRAKL